MLGEGGGWIVGVEVRTPSESDGLHFVQFAFAPSVGSWTLSVLHYR
jgi:hypothetical protein